jgi:hypothetical protein
VDLEPDRAQKVIKAMIEGDPPVAIRSVPTGIVLDPMTIMPGETGVVASRLRDVIDSLKA